MPNKTIKDNNDEKLNRAAQFAPFDALKGLQEELRKRERRRLEKQNEFAKTTADSNNFGDFENDI